MPAVAWTRAILLVAACGLVAAIGLVIRHQAEAASRAALNRAIRTIETTMVMPPGAEELDQYRRYYAWDELDGAKVVEGHFILYDGPDASPEASPVPGLDRAYAWKGKYLPVINDGGCRMVTVLFDVEANELRQLKRHRGAETALGLCNGVG